MGDHSGALPNRTESHLLIYLLGVYFIVGGLATVVRMGLSLERKYLTPEMRRARVEMNRRIEAKGKPFKYGVYSRTITFLLVSVVGGTGLLLRRLWARALLLIALPIRAFYASFSFARGYGLGSPAAQHYVVGSVLCFAWFGFLFWVLWRPATKRLLSPPSIPTLERGAY